MAVRHRGYEIVETRWTTEADVGGTIEERPVFVIRGMKERPSRPFLTSVQEAREFIDAELDAREAAAQESAMSWQGRAVKRSSSLAVTIPSRIVRTLRIEEGDGLTLTVARNGEPRRTGSPAPDGAEDD